MPDNLRSDFDKFYEEAAKWPVFYYLWNNQMLKEITRIVGLSKYECGDLIKNQQVHVKKDAGLIPAASNKLLFI